MGTIASSGDGRDPLRVSVLAGTAGNARLPCVTNITALPRRAYSGLTISNPLPALEDTGTGGSGAAANLQGSQSSGGRGIC